MAEAFESVSTWRQPEPVPLSPARTAVVAEVADRIHGLRPGRTGVRRPVGLPRLARRRPRGVPGPRHRRDTVSEGGVDAATRLHRDRYHAAFAIYLAEVDPRSRADVIVDNSDFARPRIC